MNPSLQAEELLLPHRTVHRVATGAAFEVACRQGALWITLDNDPRDIVLEAGQRFTTPAKSQALLYALKASRVTLTPVLVASPARLAHTSRGVHPVPAPRAGQRNAPGMALAR